MKHRKNRLTYIYALRDPRDLVACYIGFTQASPFARLGAHCDVVEVKTAKEAWIHGLRKNNLHPRIDILERVPSDLQSRWSAEESMIMAYVGKGCPILNLRRNGHSYRLGRPFTVDEMVQLAAGTHPGDI